MIVSIDTNILVYFVGVVRGDGDEAKVALSQALIDTLASRSTMIVATQAIGELHHFLMRHGFSRAEIEEEITDIRGFASFALLDVPDFENALELSFRHNLQIFDAMILSASADANARCLLTEDMQDGWVWRGVEIINPTGKPVEATLARLGLER